VENAAFKNILLVDDEKMFLITLAEELRYCNENFCILTADNGDRALKVLESGHVDLVITDLKMPVMNGFDLILNMRKEYPHIPVIAMSTYLYPDVETRLRGLGISQWVDKTTLSIGGLEEMIIRSCQDI
jgi:CheY-like chemotaxis protein